MTGFGLYLHIPFCDAVCHYCDFAKTAHHDTTLRHRYLARLEAELTTWLHWLEARGLFQPFSSVFWGGGTPSIFARDLAPMCHLVRNRLAPDAEITLEANPNHVTPENARIWRDLGFNRLSLGVQTFSQEGLTFLTRQHSPREARNALENALSIFSNVNLDLIYGWQGQTLESWREDLALARVAPHLSLYNLIFEEGTVLGRRKERRLIDGPSEDAEAEMFDVARSFLAVKDFHHEEVSNWSRDSFSCRHNWLYWRSEPYLGVGVGAHSFLPIGPPWGTRFFYGRDERSWLRSDPLTVATIDAALERGTGPLQVDTRGASAFAAELVLTGLRTARGVSLTEIQKATGLLWEPTDRVRSALTDGTLRVVNLGTEQFLRLDPAQWFREQKYCLDVIDSCLPKK